MYQSKLPVSYWSYAILHVDFLINRIPTPLLQGQSPYHVLHQNLPDINTFKVFGCLCHASSLQNHKTKLQLRATKTVFLGYKSSYKGHILHDIHYKEIFVSRHVVFHEHFLPYPNNNESITSNCEYFSPTNNITTDSIDTPPHAPIIDDDDYSPSSCITPLPDTSISPPVSPINSSPDMPPDIHHSPRKSMRNKTALAYLEDYI